MYVRMHTDICIYAWVALNIRWPRLPESWRGQLCQGFEVYQTNQPCIHPMTLHKTRHPFPKGPKYQTMGYIHMYLYIYVYIYIYIFLLVDIYIYVCTHIYIYMYAYVCIYLFVPIYTYSILGIVIVALGIYSLLGDLDP